MRRLIVDAIGRSIGTEQPCLLCRRSLNAYSSRSKADVGFASLLDNLDSRGLLKSYTSPATLPRHLSGQKVGLYCGYDPTAQSLHVGHLTTMIPLLHFWLWGHRVFAIVGGATGRIGDPSGRSLERPDMDLTTLSSNVKNIESQLERFMLNAKAYAQYRGYHIDQGDKTGFQVLNNDSWMKDMTLLDFLKNTGRHVKLQKMLDRDSIANRLRANDRGMTFAEMTYQLLQAYDFWWLYKNKHVTVQLGGSDQYGNIVAGIDLVERLECGDAQLSDTENASLNGDGPPAFGVTVPLVTTKSGEKLGKSAGNAVWLDPAKTSPFELYQYFVNTAEEKVESYLFQFTLLSAEEIEAIMDKHKEQVSTQGRKQPHANFALAEELVHLVHGREEGERAATMSKVIHRSDISQETASTLLNVFRDSTERVPRDDVIGARLRNIVSDAFGISKKEAHKRLESGSISIKGERTTDASGICQQSHLMDDKLLILKYGKSSIRLVELV